MGLRQVAEKITKGELKPQHLGSHTLETFNQEAISLMQTNPMFRSSKWHERHNELAKALRDSTLDKSKTRPILYELERIANQR